jgi:hypothetical protein
MPLLFLEYGILSILAPLFEMQKNKTPEIIKELQSERKKSFA